MTIFGADEDLADFAYLEQNERPYGFFNA